MYCTKCGTPLDETTGRCVTCGEVQEYGSPDPNAPYQPTRQTSGKAIASMVCSICGILVSCCCLPVPVGQILGVILGFISKNEIKVSQGRLTGEGFATAGIVVGFVGIGLAILHIIFIAVGLVGGLGGVEEFVQEFLPASRW